MVYDFVWFCWARGTVFTLLFYAGLLFVGSKLHQRPLICMWFTCRFFWEQWVWFPMERAMDAGEVMGRNTNTGSAEQV